MICPPCAKDQHEDCHVSHMGFLQAFCGCWCREVARTEEEERRSSEDADLDRLNARLDYGV